jgi:hypothetical protein
MFCLYPRAGELKKQTLNETITPKDFLSPSKSDSVMTSVINVDMERSFRNSCLCYSKCKKTAARKFTPNWGEITYITNSINSFLFTTGDAEVEIFTYFLSIPNTFSSITFCTKARKRNK